MTGVTVELGVASLARPGERESGDRHVVVAYDGGAMAGVIDALGHGCEAAQTARIAVRTLREHAGEAPAGLLRHCHSRMRDTRGATISVAVFDWQRSSIAWLGIGNVAGVLVHAGPTADPCVETLLVRGGVVGDRIPELRHSEVPVNLGDTLILATDGVRSEFAERLPAESDQQRLANHILENYATHKDDALVLVLRYTKVNR